MEVVCLVAPYTVWTVLWVQSLCWCFVYAGMMRLYFITQQRSSEHFNLLFLSSYNFNNFVTLASTRLRLPEDDADALKHVGVLTIYKILLI